MKINEVAKRTGVTVRTLHYYDQIGLLAPSRVTAAGYRLYDEASLVDLQQILFLKELDFSLAEIKRIMADPSYSSQEALKKQRKLLIMKRDRLNRLITLAERTLEGEHIMNFKAFDTTDIEKNRQHYADEMKARWGETPQYQENEKKAAGYDASQWAAIDETAKAILKAFGENRDHSPESEAVQQLVARWQEYITAHFYPCSTEMLACLGAMYTGDERFTKNIDTNGEGTAALMAAAIDVYCKKAKTDR